MSESRSDRGSTAAHALDLRRLSQLTEGSGALSLLEWPSSSLLRVATTASPAVLSLVPAESPVDVRPRVRPAAQEAARCPRPPEADDPALQEQAHGLAQALVEILAGDRTLTQLVRWTSAEVYEQLHHRVRTLATCARSTTASDSASTAHPASRRRRRPRVASLHVSTPTDGIAEVSARIDHGVRSTAIALRLERRSAARRVAGGGTAQRVPDERWLCTAVTWA